MGKTYTEILTANEATTIKQNDIQVLTQDGQSKGLRYSVIEYNIYALVVNSQTDFNNVIERAAANQYKIKDGIYALTFKPLVGGYKMYGGTSPLSGGDTWGYIQTNQCTKLKFDTGTYIDYGLTIGYIDCNTPSLRAKNIYVKGDDTGAAAAIIQSFLISANDVKLDGCITSNRYSNVPFYAFKGSNAYRENSTLNCRVHSIKNDTNFIRAFDSIRHLRGCNIYDINSSTAFALLIDGCYSVIDCSIHNIIADIIIACSSKIIKGTWLYNINGNSSTVGFQGGEIMGCHAEQITDIGGTAYGFDGGGAVGGNRFMGCHAISCDNGFNNGRQIIGCYAQSNTTNGFNGCLAMSNNRSTGNSTNYNNCFADWAGTQAVADTAIGGYNG